jgi:hypothetical protein
MLSIDNFILFLEKHGSIFNIAYNAYNNDEFLEEQNLDTNNFQECSSITDCVTSVSAVGEYTGGHNTYFKQILVHPNNFSNKSTDYKGYLSDNICNLLSQISNKGIKSYRLQIEIQNVVEMGAHVFSIIVFENRCYLVQTYADRYTYKIDKYPTINILMNYFAIMFDEVNDINTKITIYNKLIHARATMKDYQDNLSFIKKLSPNILYPPNTPFDPAIMHIDVTEFHLPSINILITTLEQLYERTLELHQFNKEVIKSLMFLNQI